MRLPGLLHQGLRGAADITKRGIKGMYNCLPRFRQGVEPEIQEEQNRLIREQNQLDQRRQIQDARQELLREQEKVLQQEQQLAQQQQQMEQ